MDDVSLIDEVIADGADPVPPEFPRDDVRRTLEDFAEEVVRLLAGGKAAGSEAGNVNFKIDEATRAALDAIRDAWEDA